MELTANDQSADGVYQVTNGKAHCQLQGNAAPKPLLILHFCVHCADGCEAGRRVEVKHQVGQSGDLGDGDDAGYVGAGAFQALPNLKKVELGPTVTTIGSYAFKNCSRLTSITIPDSVTSVGVRAFSGCSALTAVHITNLSTWCAINFDNADTNPLFYAKNLYLNGERLTELVIPESVTGIGTYAFAGCSKLTGIVIPDSVISIGSGAFYNCSGLTSIHIPDSVISIGSGAFSGCKNLESLTIPFVGAEAGKTAEDTYQYPFGYIFGTTGYTGSEAIEQSYYGYSTSSTTCVTYWIPTNLTSVTVTSGNILYGAE